MLRTVKILLVISVALWGFVGAFGNLADWRGTLASIGAVTSMASFEGGAESWRSTDAWIVIWTGALFILLSKLATGILCLLGAGRMWLTRADDLAAFNKSKEVALAGCAVAVLMLFGGFIVIAESWFELWRSDAMRGPVLESALRYAAMIALIGIFVNGKEN